MLLACGTAATLAALMLTFFLAEAKGSPKERRQHLPFNLTGDALFVGR